MRLTDLTLPGEGPLPDIEIAGLTADSRAVRPGFLFAALPGTRADGRRFVVDALARGAVAVLTGPDGLADPVPVPVLRDANPRRRLARIAARLHPGQPGTAIAVTGTNGKTSVADFTRQLWALLGHRAVSLGTLGVRGPADLDPRARVDAPLTTPEPVVLHRTLAALAADGVTHLAMEASSHGLVQYRLDAVHLVAGAFTNLSRDHLDYHPDEAAYLAAKSRLFAEVMPVDAAAVLNADGPEFEGLRQICADRGHRILSYGWRGVVLQLDAQTPTPQGQTLRLRISDRSYTVELPLAGAFQAGNALAALGLVLATGAPEEEAVAALAHLQGVPGRLQRAARNAAGAEIFVDYAHTPDALRTVLRALRPHARRRLIAVFGAGGDRDPGKRSTMGRVVARLADLAIVTDDNPRGEDPAAIRAQILAGCPGAMEIGDRAAAIRAAVIEAGAGDVVAICGKGHEQGQTVGDQVLPFDDVAVVRAAAALPAGGRA